VSNKKKLHVCFFWTFLLNINIQTTGFAYVFEFQIVTSTMLDKKTLYTSPDPTTPSPQYNVAEAYGDSGNESRVFNTIFENF